MGKPYQMDMDGHRKVILDKVRRRVTERKSRRKSYGLTSSRTCTLVEPLSPNHIVLGMLHEGRSMDMVPCKVRKGLSTAVDTNDGHIADDILPCI